MKKGMAVETGSGAFAFLENNASMFSGLVSLCKFSHG